MTEPGITTIYALAARLRAARAARPGRVSMAMERARPNVDLDDPDLMRRLTAECVGSDADDAPEPEPVKARGNRRPLKFRERDISRAIAGHLKAGLSVQRTEIDASGRIVIVTGQPEPTTVAPVNEWDTVK